MVSDSTQAEFMKGSARFIIYVLKFQDRSFSLPVLTGEIELCGMHFTCVGFTCTSARRTTAGFPRFTTV